MPVRGLAQGEESSRHCRRSGVSESTEGETPPTLTSESQSAQIKYVLLACMSRYVDEIQPLKSVSWVPAVLNRADRSNIEVQEARESTYLAHIGDSLTAKNTWKPSESFRACLYHTGCGSQRVTSDD